MRSFRRALSGVLIVAAFTAVHASGAAAVEFHSASADGHTIISGSQVGIAKFSTTAGEITCETATFSGTAISSTVSSIRLTGTTSGCHINFFGSKVGATVNQNGCEGIAYANGEGELVCPAGKSVTVVAAGCTITVGPQKNNGATITNVENHIKVQGNTTGIKYSHTGFTCGTGSGTNGTAKGEATVKATDTEGSPTKIWVE